MTRPTTAELLTRLDARTLIAPSGCWLWQGGCNGVGYGHLFVDGRAQYVHRLSYEARVGLIPDGLQIDHLCRIRNCLNPIHLEPVTRSENVRRGKQANRPARCPNGHLYTAGSYRTDDRGWRFCLTCRRAMVTRRNYKRRGLPKSITGEPHGNRRSHCKYGHSLDDAYVSAAGNRSCRPCAIERARRRHVEQQMLKARAVA